MSAHTLPREIYEAGVFLTAQEHATLCIVFGERDSLFLICWHSIKTNQGRSSANYSVVLSIVTDRWLVSANGRALYYDVELSIINRKYVQIYHNLLFCFNWNLKSKIIWTNGTMSAMQNVAFEKFWSKWSDGWYHSLVPSSIHVRKRRLTNRLRDRSSIVSAKPTIGCENRTDFQHYFSWNCLITGGNLIKYCKTLNVRVGFIWRVSPQLENREN